VRDLDALVYRIIGERRAIVDPMAGLTRDRLYAEAEWRGRRFTIVDTAGLVLGKDRDEVPEQRELRRRMEEQSRLAIEEADIILFVLDVREGLTAVDRDIAELLRRSRTPVLILANKSDGRGREVLATEFYWREPPTDEAREVFLGQVCPGMRFDSIEEWTDIYGGASLADIKTESGPFAMMTARGFLADERGHAPAVMVRAMSRPAYVRKMAWLMPRMARAIPYLGYVLVSGTKPGAPETEAP